jgi:hypothetical protein
MLLTLFSIIIALIVNHSTDIAGLLLIVELAIKMEYVTGKEEGNKMQKSNLASDKVASLP